MSSSKMRYEPTISVEYDSALSFMVPGADKWLHLEGKSQMINGWWATDQNVVTTVVAVSLQRNSWIFSRAKFQRS